MSGSHKVLSIRESKKEKLEEIVLRIIVSRLRGIELELSQIANTLTLMDYQSSSEDLVRALKYVGKVINYLDDYTDTLTFS